MVYYCDVDLRKWKVFSSVDEQTLKSVELAHVFGVDASSAFFILPNDEVFAVGNNVLGRLGVGEEDIIEAPVRVSQLCGEKVICFSSSSQYVLALTQAGDVYSWGANDYGQLGIGSDQSQLFPTKVKFPDEDRIKEISTAEQYSLALSENNKLYHWGDTGWNYSQFEKSPSIVNLPKNIIVTSICCGAHHAAALTDDGKVLTWGLNDFGQLGSGQVERLETPKVVRGQIEHKCIIQVTCSYRTTLVLTNKRELYVWGYNKISKMPIGCDTDVINFPERVRHMTNVVNIASNNLLHVLCAEQNDPQKISIWGYECVNKGYTYANVIEAFTEQAMPVTKRRKITEESQPRNIGVILFNNKETSDLTVHLADGEVYVHKLIMRTFSEHFKTLLDDNWANGENCIDMTQYNPKAYRAFLKYVYTGLLGPLEGTDIIALCDIAVSYFENDLKRLCINRFNHCLTIRNVAHLYDLAAGNHSSLGISLTHTTKKFQPQNNKKSVLLHLELVKSCIHFVSENLIPVILSDGFEALSPLHAKSLIREAAKVKDTL